MINARTALLLTFSLAGCGLESALFNAGHVDFERPASKITGKALAGSKIENYEVIDGDGNVIEPFQAALSGDGGSYELRLPSAKYQMLRVRLTVGNVELRVLVPEIGEESAVSGVDFDVRNVTETIITEARLSFDATNLKTVTPSAYLGTRALIRAAFDKAGPTKDLLDYMTRLMTLFDATLSVTSPNFFIQPVVDNMYVVKTSPLEPGFILRMPFDFVGDGRVRKYTDDYDAKLVEVLKLYRPAGCPSPDRIRLLFTVDFKAGSKNGNCGDIDRFKWAKDKPGKGMFFVGWVYTLDPPGASSITDPDTNNLVGGAIPNSLPMSDDGTNGDEKSGDGIWSIYFDVPRAKDGKVLRVGYKYTWGTRGAPWTGSEEWPGNARMIEVVDDNGDDIVYRHDVFGDESTNKDNSNLNLKGSGSLTWTTDLHGCGTPEAHENKFDNNSCTCASVLTPKWIGPLTVTCTQ